MQAKWAHLTRFNPEEAIEIDLKKQRYKKKSDTKQQNKDLSLMDLAVKLYQRTVKDLAKQVNCSWLIMAGGTTPVYQPLGWLLNKLFKENYCDLCDQWMVTAPINLKTGHPIPISRQLWAQWAVLAWEKIPNVLVKKAWTGCGFKSLQSDPSTDLVLGSGDDTVQMIEELAGEEAVAHFLKEENEHEEFSVNEEGGVGRGAWGGRIQCSKIALCLKTWTLFGNMDMGQIWL